MNIRLLNSTKGDMMVDNTTQQPLIFRRKIKGFTNPYFQENPTNNPNSSSKIPNLNLTATPTNEICSPFRFGVEKSYIIELFKQGNSEKELKEIVKNISTIKDIKIDNSGKLIMDEKPADNGVYNRITYDKNGKIESQTKMCDFFNYPRRYIESEDGTILLQSRNNVFKFKNIDAFNAKMFDLYTRSEKGFLSAVVENPTYRDNGTIESSILHNYQNDSDLLAYYDKDGKDSIWYTNSDSQKKIYTHNKDIVTRYTYNENGQVERIVEYNKSEPNFPCTDGDILIDSKGRIDYQGNFNMLDNYVGWGTQKVGDCYFHAALNAIRQLDNGQEILSKMIKHTKDGGAEVTFPSTTYWGEKYPTCYKFTKDEIYAINQSNKYAIGDLDIRLLEAAFEKFLSIYSNNTKELGDGGEPGLVIATIFTCLYRDMFVTPTPKIPSAYMDSWHFVSDNSSKIVTEYDPDKMPKTGKTLTEIKNDPKYKTDTMQRKIQALELLKEAQVSNDKNWAGIISFKTTNASHAVAIKEVLEDGVILKDSNYREPYKISIDYFLDIVWEITIINGGKESLLDYNVFSKFNNNLPSHVIQKIQNTPEAKVPEEYEDIIKF